MALAASWDTESYYSNYSIITGKGYCSSLGILGTNFAKVDEISIYKMSGSVKLIFSSYLLSVMQTYKHGPKKHKAKELANK